MMLLARMMAKVMGGVMVVMIGNLSLYIVPSIVESKP